MENTKIHPSLISGARGLIANIESPAQLLEFLLRMIDSLNNFERDTQVEKNKSKIFDLTVFIEHIVQPWLTNSGNTDEAVTHIAAGLQKMAKWFGSEGYGEGVAAITIAMGYRMQDGLMLEEYELKYHDCLRALTSLYYSINEYDEEDRLKANSAA